MSDRRSFLKNTGALIAFSTIGFPSYLYSGQKKKLGVALAGLGYYSRDLLAPALQQTQYCELRGIITGSPDKIPIWQKKYNIPDANVYNYENMHRIADNDDIDVVYIVLPNGLHAKYSVIAAEAGKHVWCEKPMAMTVEECEQIISACKKNKVKLTVGYRMQHEPNTRTVMKWAETLPYGKIREVMAEAGFRNGARNKDHWKLRSELGGGAMYDMGVYPLNAARYATGLEPVNVSAVHKTSRPELFDEVDETTLFKLEFPGGIIANCRTSFGENINRLEVECENGSYYLSPMQSYSGVSGKSSDGKVLSPFNGIQQAKQMDDDALAIINKSEVLVPGEEGLRDIRIVQAIFKSAKEGGRTIRL